MLRNCVQLLKAAMVRNDSLVCCGLDPDLSRMPLEARRNWGGAPEAKVLRFLQTVVECTAQHVCAYKIQKAFFDVWPQGHRLLRDTIAFIQATQPDLPVILDCKVGDIDNTLRAYLHNAFIELGADGIVVNPYMGDDVMAPFTQLPSKAAIVLVRTSNPGAAIAQDARLSDGSPVWRHVLELVVGRWNEAGNMIPVLPSTGGLGLRTARELIPDAMPVLVSGFGAQGGDAAAIWPFLDSHGTGVFVNYSRGLMYPYSIEDSEWRAAIMQATCAMKEQLNRYRRDA